MKLIKEHIPRIRRESIYCIDIEEWPSVKRIEAAIPILFREISCNNYDDVAQFRNKSIMPIFYKFVQEGHVGVMAYIEEKAVAHGWMILCKASPILAHKHFPLMPGEGYIHYCHVVEHSRGKRIYPLMLQHLADIAFSDGCELLYVGTSPNNIPSRKGIAAAGFIYLKDEWLIRWGGRGWRL